MKKEYGQSSHKRQSGIGFELFQQSTSVEPLEIGGEVGSVSKFAKIGALG